MLHRHHNSVHQDEKGNRIFEVTVIHHVEEDSLAVLRLVDLDTKLLALSNFLDLNPRTLLLCDEHIAELLLFFDCIKVVDNHTHE